MRRIWEWFKGVIRSVALAFSAKSAPPKVKPRTPPKRAKRHSAYEFTSVTITTPDSEWLSRDFSRAMDSVDIAMSQVGRALDEVGDALRNKPIGTPTEVKPAKKDDDFNIN